jgi:hypothetical protein
MSCIRSVETQRYITDLLHSINAKVNRALRCIIAESNLSLEDLNEIRILTAKIELTDQNTCCSQQTELEFFYDVKK